jgi:signal transduction histidine kinase
VERGKANDGASVVVDLSAHAAGYAHAGEPHTAQLQVAPPSATGLLDELVTDFARFDGHPDTAVAFEAAAVRARALAVAAGGGEDAQRSAGFSFAADALVAVALERSGLEETIDEMVSVLAQLLEASSDAVSLELFVRTVAHPGVLALPPQLAVDLQLQLLFALAPVSDVSIWADGGLHRVSSLAHVGDSLPTRRVRHVARALLDGGEDASGRERGTIHGVAVLRFQQPYAALVARARPEDRARTLVFLQEAATRIGPVLERDLLIERNAAHERGLVEAREKRLLRLGFDLHDGPIQDLVALAGDVRLAQAQIGDHVRGRTRKLVLGRFDDITAQIIGLDAKLRELSHSLEPSGVVERPILDVLRHLIDNFENRGNLPVTFEFRGDFEGMTASQRIALYRIVQEGLANIRKHSDATKARVTLFAAQTAIELQIVDDGKGFCVDQTLIRAAKGGRLGLVGIGERIRMLGGTFDVESGPGGPTTLSLVLPRWRPVGAPEDA